MAAGQSTKYVIFEQNKTVLTQSIVGVRDTTCQKARLAQLVERKALNLVVVGSSPTVGTFWIKLVLAVANIQREKLRPERFERPTV